MSYEFLASFEQWEQDCRSVFITQEKNKDVPEIDKLPIDAEASAFSKAQVMATLMGTELAGLVKDGVRKGKTKGYPGLMKNCPIVKGSQDNKNNASGKDSEDSNTREIDRWLELLLPSPEKLSCLPDGVLLLRVDVELLTPFFSKDDTAFYPTDNVLRRDKVFEIPFLSAAGVKGLLRWAHRMASDSITDDTAAEVLFGKARDGDNEDSRQGLLYFWPLIWASGNIGLDVINPLNRDTSAGTIPIKYEVVLPKAKGSLYFLLMPAREKDGIDNAALQDTLLRDLGWLLENGGLSAKKTADWGRVKINALNAAMVGCTEKASAPGVAPLDDWKDLVDGDSLKPQSDFTNAMYQKILVRPGSDWSNGKIKKDKDAAYAAVLELYQQMTAPPEESGDAKTEWIWPEGKETANLDAFCGTLRNIVNKEAQK